jgi:hypothetical protein
VNDYGLRKQAMIQLSDSEFVKSLCNKRNAKEMHSNSRCQEQQKRWQANDAVLMRIAL